MESRQLNHLHQAQIRELCEDAERISSGTPLRLPVALQEFSKVELVPNHLTINADILCHCSTTELSQAQYIPAYLVNLWAIPCGQDTQQIYLNIADSNILPRLNQCGSRVGLRIR